MGASSDDWGRFKNWLLIAVLSAGGSLFMYELHEMRTSIQNVNSKLDAWLEKTIRNDKALEDIGLKVGDHEGRIRHLEGIR